MTSDDEDDGRHQGIAVAADGSDPEPGRGRAPLARLAVAVAGWSGVLALGFAISTPPAAERAVARGVYSMPDASTPVFEVAMQAGIRGAIVVLAAILAAARRWRAAAGAVLAGFGAWALMRVMKAVIERPRPTSALLDHVPRSSADGWAYPSGHATVSAALATIVVLMVAEHRSLVRWAAVVVAVLTAVARVHLGVHWPLDVMAGAVVGVLAAWVVAPLLQPTQATGTATRTPSTPTSTT